MGNDSITPMVKQYLRIKEQYNDSILLYRIGDFYEMFYEDAVIASKLLDITLTSRNKNNPNPVPLCGVPYHSVEPYIARLISCGKKVAICDQVEDPRTAKGVVRREVTRVITPGIIIDDGEAIRATSHNFLAAITTSLPFVRGGTGWGMSDLPPLTHAYKGGERISYGLAIADVSTGHFSASKFDTLELLLEEVARLEPREILIPKSLAKDQKFQSRISRPNFEPLFTSIEDTHFAPDSIMKLEGASDLAGSRPVAARCAGAIWFYIKETQKGEPRHIRRIETSHASKTMRLDEATKRNLELFATIMDGDLKGSLLALLDRTSTAMGARKLKEWMLYPLMDVRVIESRLNAVEIILKTSLVRDLPPLLKRVYDLERIGARIAMGRASARDLIALKESLKIIPLIIEAIKNVIARSPMGDVAISGDCFVAKAPCNDNSDSLLNNVTLSLDPLIDVTTQIEKTIMDEPPLNIRDGGCIKQGVNPELDELRSISSGGKDAIAGIEARERLRTGINSLKVKYNKVFGYYIEVTNAHKDKVPADFIRKQTLVGAERYITPELKDFEDKVLAAEDKIRVLEYDIFCKVREEIAAYADGIRKTADALAVIDVLTSFATIAGEYRYARPKLTDGREINIVEGRHPIIERINPIERFVPNDVFLDDGANRLLIITGPNMAGKSTVMRQTAIIVLLAQMGSFVPAKEATIGIVDRIFTRIGASDALALGQSTFMVEMREAATILKEASERSLVVIDEIGRGTSTFDGLSIAWAVVEDLHDRVRARTLFATHYHELTELALTKEGIKNFNIAVKEWNGEVIFLRKLVPGGTSRSYGIQVAKLAGLPQSVIERSHEVLRNLEAGELDEIGKPRLASHAGEAVSGISQLQLFSQPLNHEIAERLETLDTSTLTPIEALNILHELKQKI